ncbi:hypothetical protein AB0I91_29990 [Actinosynnema sp. NPDC049800]
MPGFESFASALSGDDRELRAAAGPDGIVCVAPDLASVFLVQVGADGTQSTTLAIVREGGGSSVNRIEVPASFRISGIRHDHEHFTLTAVDGRTAHGTPRQFVEERKLLDEEHNPRYHEQLEEVFLATHLIPVRDWSEAVDAVTTDRGLDGPGVEEIVRLGQAQVVAGDLDLSVTFDGAGPEKVAELLPHVRDLLAEFDRVSRDGLEFLWDKSSDGSEPDGAKARFLTELVPAELVVYRSGDFEIHFVDTTESYYLDGYWPAVQFTADATPVSETVEA